MRAEVDRPALADALAWVALAVPRKPSHLALSGVRVEAGDGEILLRASDYDQSHTASVPADVGETGELLVPGHLARELAAAIRTKSLDLYSEGPALMLKAGRSEYRLNGLPLDQYPTIPDQPERVGEVDAEVLRGFVRSVGHAVDDDDPRAGFQGVLLEAAEGVLRAVGATSTTIAVAEVDFEGKPFVVRLPLGMLEDAVKGLTGTVELGHVEGLLGLACEGRAVTLRTLASVEVAPWRRLVRSESQTRVTVDAAALLDAVKRVGLTCKGDEPVRLVAVEGELSAGAGSSDLALGVEYLDATTSVETDAEVEALFGRERLVEVLSALPSGFVTIGLDGRKAAIFTPEDESAVHVLATRRPAR